MDDWALLAQHRWGKFRESRQALLTYAEQLKR